VLEDVDLTSEPAFLQFAEAKKPDSHPKRFLAAIAWWKAARGLDGVTVDHIYTCYRHAEWPANIPDFAQPLRNLKFKQKIVQRADGLYAINHLGQHAVDKLGG
jgi:hypothetical protein